MLPRLDSGPIILKELMQATRQRRTYLLRALLPAITVVILAVWLPWVLREGQDWRTIKEIAHPIFQTSAWMQLIVFSLLAAVYARGTLQGEWTRRTLETLCATPISRRGILYGKFAGVVGRILLAGLALLPIMGIWFRLGRIPREVALGTLGVVGASTVMFGGLAFVRAAMLVPRKAHGRLCLDLLLLCLLLPLFLGLAVWPGAAVLVAAVPPWSFHYVMTGTSPLGVPPGHFALLAIGEPLGIGLAALAVTPWVFGRALERAGAARAASRGWRRRVAMALRGGRTLRPQLKPRGNPFVWQEKGPPTAILRWGPLVLFAIVAVFAIGIAEQYGRLDDLVKPQSLNTLTSIAAYVVTILTLIYATRVFAREKVQRTADALLLTGHPPRTFYLAKMWSLFWSLRYAYLVIAVLIVAIVVFSPGQRRAYELYGGLVFTQIANLVMGATLGLLPFALIGMAVGAAARSPWQALGIAVLSIVGAWIATWLISLVGTLLLFAGSRGFSLGSGPRFSLPEVFGLFLPSLLGMGGIVLLCLLLRRWNAWLVGLLAALTQMVAWNLMSAISTIVMLGSFDFGEVDPDAYALTQVLVMVASVIADLGLAAFWLLFGLRVFDRCMRSETGRSPRRPPIFTIRPVLLIAMPEPPGQEPRLPERPA